MKLFKLIGRRVIKTGIAVFITAFVCLKLDLPVIFAVITAIVTTEPTAADSLKKGLVRLPAAAIGACFALLIDYLLGQSATTFALVTMLTIVFCHHAKLDNGTLVATLTAVAMIPGSNEGLISDFILRLSGTSIGIIISTGVNFAILPPKFGPLLVNKVNELFIDSATHLESLFFSKDSQEEINKSNIQLRKLNQKLESAYKISHYQQLEWNYRKTSTVEQKSFKFLNQKLNQLQKIISHIRNISVIEIKKLDLSDEEAKVIHRIVKKVVEVTSSFLYEIDDDHKMLQGQLYNFFKKEVSANPDLDDKKTLYYELLAILNCLTVLEKTTKNEQIFSSKNANYPAYIFGRNIQYD